MTWYLIYFLSCPIIIDWMLQKVGYQLSKMEFIVLYLLGWLIMPLAIIRTIVQIIYDTHDL